MGKSKKHENVKPTIHQLFNERAVVLLRERNGDRGGTNDLYFGSDGFGPTVRPAPSSHQSALPALW